MRFTKHLAEGAADKARRREAREDKGTTGERSRVARGRDTGDRTRPTWTSMVPRSSLPN